LVNWLANLVAGIIFVVWYRAMTDGISNDHAKMNSVKKLTCFLNLHEMLVYAFSQLLLLPVFILEMVVAGILLVSSKDSDIW
jgi:hypothetical protein